MHRRRRRRRYVSDRGSWERPLGRRGEQLRQIVGQIVGHFVYMARGRNQDEPLTQPTVSRPFPPRWPWPGSASRAATMGGTITLGFDPSKTEGSLVYEGYNFSASAKGS